MSSRKIGVTELVPRDAHQSLMVTRMALEDMADACVDIDAAGYWSVECWGGATFDSCIRFLNEDPWVRLRMFRELMPNIRLQMLLCGQNLLGYRHYEDTVVEEFVEKSAESGMDVFRVFDALNDPRDMAQAIQAVRRIGKHAQGTICYIISPVHTAEGYVKLTGQLIDMGAESIALKDMAALLQPQPAYGIIRGIKEAYGDIQINVHCYPTTDVTLVSLMKAIEAGADVVDTAILSTSLDPGHNPTKSLVAMLEGTDYTADPDMDRLARTRDHFAKIRPKYAEPGSATLVGTDIFSSQIPGGMLSNMEPQLRAQGAGDRIDEVMAEIPLVKADAGHSPLVTPSSRIVGTQIVFNVLMGRYKVLTGEFADLILGCYGECLDEHNPEVIELVQTQVKKDPVTVRPADLLRPEWDEPVAQAKELEGADGAEEDVLTNAIFPGVALGFFKTRAEGPKNVGKTARQLAAEKEAAKRKAQGTSGPARYNVTTAGHSYSVSVEPV